jgi:hypothetical protein
VPVEPVCARTGAAKTDAATSATASFFNITVSFCCSGSCRAWIFGFLRSGRSRSWVAFCRTRAEPALKPIASTGSHS